MPAGGATSRWQAGKPDEAPPVIELDAAVRSNNTVRVMARNISTATLALAAATLWVGAAKRRLP